MTEWNRETVSALLERNDTAVERAILKIYEFQTNVEKSEGYTKENNGVGFGGIDGVIFSSFAEQLKRGRHLSPKQLAICRAPQKNGTVKLAKYWKQLLSK